jgi:hypothetical protein
MKRFLLPETLILIFIVSLIACNLQRQFLVSKLRSQLLAEKFSELYDQSADTVHLNASREEFVRRMKVAVTKLKSIDETLNFQRDIETEKMFSGFGDESITIRAYQKLEKDGKAVAVMLYWDGTGKFRDLSVIPSAKTSQGCWVPGVSYTTTSLPPTLSSPCP